MLNNLDVFHCFTIFTQSLSNLLFLRQYIEGNINLVTKSITIENTMILEYNNTLNYSSQVFEVL